MSKNINTDRMNTEKDLAKLMEEIKKQGLGTVVEINDFLKNIQEKVLMIYLKELTKKDVHKI